MASQSVTKSQQKCPDALCSWPVAYTQTSTGWFRCPGMGKLSFGSPIHLVLTVTAPLCLKPLRCRVMLYSLYLKVVCILSQPLQSEVPSEQDFPAGQTHSQASARRTRGSGGVTAWSGGGCETWRAGSCLKQLEKKCELKQAPRTNSLAQFRLDHLPFLSLPSSDKAVSPVAALRQVTSSPAQRGGSQRDWANGNGKEAMLETAPSQTSRLCSLREFVFHLKDHLFPTPLLGSTLASVIS